MTQTEYKTEGVGQSQCDLILAELLKSKGQWVSMLKLHEVSGAFAVHSRVSDLRARGYSIANRNERQDSGSIHSFYMLLER
jgi:hypothetical protein